MTPGEIIFLLTYAAVASCLYGGYASAVSPAIHATRPLSLWLTPAFTGVGLFIIEEYRLVTLGLIGAYVVIVVSAMYLFARPRELMRSVAVCAVCGYPWPVRDHSRDLDKLSCVCTECGAERWVRIESKHRPEVRPRQANRGGNWNLGPQFRVLRGASAVLPFGAVGLMIYAHSWQLSTGRIEATILVQSIWYVFGALACWSSSQAAISKYRSPHRRQPSDA